MTNRPRQVSLGTFIGAALLFLLPFVTVTCQQQEVVSFSGLQLVTGTTLRDPNTGKEEKTGSETWAVVALGCALVGAVVSRGRAKGVKIACAALGVGGALALLLLKTAMDNEILQSGQGMLQLHYLFGFWLATLVLLGAGVLNIVAATEGNPVSDRIAKQAQQLADRGRAAVTAAAGPPPEGGAAPVFVPADSPETRAKRHVLEMRLGQNPADVPLLMEYGDFLLSIGLGDEALVQLHTAAQLDPGNDEVQRHLVEGLRRAGRLADAAGALRTLLARAPHDLGTLRQQRDLLRSLHQPAAASDCCRQILDLDPNDTLSRKVLATALLEASGVEAAAEAFRGLLDVEPDNARACLYGAIASYWAERASAEGDGSSALRLLQRSRLHVGTLPYSPTIADEDLDNLSLQEARRASLYVAACQLQTGMLSPESVQDLWGIRPEELTQSERRVAADCLIAAGDGARAARRLDEALRAYERARDFGEDDTLRSRLADALADLGDAHADSKAYLKAMKNYQLGLRWDRAHLRCQEGDARARHEVRSRATLVALAAVLVVAAIVGIPKLPWLRQHPPVVGVIGGAQGAPAPGVTGVPTAASAPPAAAAAPISPFDPSRLSYGSQTYRESSGATSVGSYARRLQRTTDGGPPMLQLVASRDRRDWRSTDTVRMDAASLAPVSVRHVRAVGRRIEQLGIDYSGPHVVGRSHMLEGTTFRDAQVDTTLTSGTLDQYQLWSAVPLLPLAPGGRWVLQVYSASQRAVRAVALSVQGQETVSVPAGQIPCWKVLAETDSQPSVTYYVTTSVPFLVVKAMVAAGGTITELASYQAEPTAPAGSPTSDIERAYVAAMKSDLRNLLTAQEAYFADHRTYAAAMSQLQYASSAGVTVTLGTVSATGWNATTRHQGISTVCGVFVGGAPAMMPGQMEGIPACR